MDDVDRTILSALAANARASGAALAAAAGVAESTVALRVRRLRESGVIRGYRAELDPALLGLTVQALIAVRLVSIVRDDVVRFWEEAPGWPGVLGVFHMGGLDDFLIHVAARDSEELRDFVIGNLAEHPAVAHTQTNLIFDHTTGRGLDLVLGADPIAFPERTTSR